MSCFTPLTLPPPGSRARRIAMTRNASAILVAFVSALSATACGSNDEGSADAGNDGSIGDFSEGGLQLGDDGGVSDVLVLPTNFVPTEKGGYALGPPIAAAGSDAGVAPNGRSSCALVVGIVRDFKSYQIEPGGHPDFERYQGDGPTPGLVAVPIGADRKPVYNNECDDNGAPNPPCIYKQQLTTKANFDEWYRFTSGVNDPYLIYLQFVPNGGVYTFQSTAFFPLDNAGFGNTPGFNHNFSFTTEVHLKFTYVGGETFSFTGDDDLWVFIDGKLAIDLGGLHTPSTAVVALDTLGLTKGSEYDIELFNAERHSTGSNFRVDTNLAFTNCGTLPPDIPK